MAAEVLETCLVICKFFYNEKQLNDEAKCVLADLADYVMRLSQPLQSLNTRGLESAALQLSHLWACLKECKRIYVKYKDGWKRRFVTFFMPEVEDRGALAARGQL
jgi:hypothetical protein